MLGFYFYKDQESNIPIQSPTSKPLRLIIRPQVKITRKYNLISIAWTQVGMFSTKTYCQNYYLLL